MAGTRDAEKMVRWLVGLHAGKTGWRCEDVEPGLVRLHGPGGPWDVSLEAVRRRVAPLPRGEWGEGVGQLLDELCRSTPEDTDDIEVVRPRLRTRLYPADLAAERSLVCRDVGQDVVEALIVDGTTTMWPVTQDRAERWPVGHHQLFAWGRENVRAGDPLEGTTFESHGVDVTLLRGDDYTSAHVFWLDEFGLVGTHGAVVSVPTTTAMLVSPIDDDTDWDVLAAVADPTCTLYDDGDERPIARRLFHWEPGAMDALDMLMGAAGLFPGADGVTNLVIHPDFQEMFERRAVGS